MPLPCMALGTVFRLLVTCRFQKDLLTVNLDVVSKRIQQGRLDTSSVITMQTLRDAGLIGKKVSSGVKLLGRVSIQSAHLVLGIKLHASSRTTSAKLKAVVCFRSAEGACLHCMNCLSPMSVQYCLAALRLLTSISFACYFRAQLFAYFNACRTVCGSCICLVQCVWPACRVPLSFRLPCTCKSAKPPSQLSKQWRRLEAVLQQCTTTSWACEPC